MKGGLEYLEELLGHKYFHESHGWNIHTENIYCAPESSLQMMDLPEGPKREYIEKVISSSGKTLDDYLYIRAFCPYHGTFEVFRPNEVGARYNNVFCPKCIDHEVQLVDNEWADRDKEEAKQKALQVKEEAKQARRRNG